MRFQEYDENILITEHQIVGHVSRSFAYVPFLHNIPEQIMHSVFRAIFCTHYAGPFAVRLSTSIKMSSQIIKEVDYFFMFANFYCIYRLTSSVLL